MGARMVRISLSKFYLLPSIVLIFGCTHKINPLSPESLAGEYDLVSYMDKRVDVLYETGVPTDNGTGQLTSFSGNLILTETKFQILRVITFYSENNESRTVNESVEGDYFIQNKVFVVVVENSGKSDSIPIRISDDFLILEDSDFKFVYRRND